MSAKVNAPPPPTGPPPSTAGTVNVGVDGKPTNQRFRNMFEEEVVLTEKQKMRKEMVDNKDKVKEALKHMTPIDIFILFDEDDSGLISFEEFRKMLPFLNIYISDAKAFRYFRLCDTDGSGEIDIDEFRVALFTCDPTSGNPVGFKPSNNLTPLDAFELFDEDRSGFLEEDEYRYAVEYLGINAADELLEDLFYKADYNLLGMIDYDEFREIFIQTCDLRRELEDRGIDPPSFIRKVTLQTMLRDILVEEETRERKALAEARRYKQWILNIRESKKLMQKAEFRAYYELRQALDAAGQVYTIGTGSYNQFNMAGYDQLRTKKFKFEYFDRILELWRDRIQPQQLIDRLKAARKAEEQEEARDAERNVTATGLGAIAKMMSNKKLAIDPYAEALLSPFAGIQVAMNTAALWGKRIYQVAVSESVIFALADTGEVYSWGGDSYWWDEIQPDSIYQRQWRGDTTYRSQLLLGTQGKALPADASMGQSIGGGAGSNGMLLQELDALSPEEKKVEMIKMVAKYYNVWTPPPNPSPAERQLFLEKDILPKIDYDSVKFSLILRGKPNKEQTKLEMIEDLYEDILLEKRLLGEKAHKSIREVELQVKELKRKKRDKLANKFMKKVDSMWQPLREVQAEGRAHKIAKAASMEHEEQVKSAMNYQAWRHRIVEKRENTAEDNNRQSSNNSKSGHYTPRGNSLAISRIGITPRGPDHLTPRTGYEAALQVSSGTAHAALVHKTGQLYTWGLGTSGRLGLDITEQGDPQADVKQPTLVQALLEKPVIRIACGFSHTGCIVSGGELYMWGSTVTGKCGLGEYITRQEECYCSIPTRVMIGQEDRRVKRLSCGAAHTGVVTETGQLYVFGCGDGGRLGLAPGFYQTCYIPTLVTCLLHEQIAVVSCGNTTTIVATEIHKTWVGEMEDKYRKLTGGRVYIAGSGNVFGRQIDEFQHLPVRGEEQTLPRSQLSRGRSRGGGSRAMLAIEDAAGMAGAGIPEEDENEVCIKQVSAGYMHTAIVSAEGELFCWGYNRTGCCGQPLVQMFIPKPTAVDFFYTKPMNLALGKKAYQSSTYNQREAKFAVNGKKEGLGVNRCTCTQQESQPWLEIDLGKMAVIDKIIIYNRTDIPTDRDQARDLYTSRLYPCWIMLGRDPFPRQANVMGLKESLRIAVCRAKLTEDKRVNTWRCPSNAQGRYIRVQLEKYNSLSIAEIEIYGYWGYSSGVGRCSYAVAGRDVTVACVRPSHDPRDIESFYQRAAYADAANADILRQMETYVLEYDKFGRGEVLAAAAHQKNASHHVNKANESLSGNGCAICHGIDLCEACMVYETFHAEMLAMEPVIGGRRRRLHSIADYLYNSNKPPLEVFEVKKAPRPNRWQVLKEAMIGKIPFMKYLFPITTSYIKPEDAMQTDPDELMTSLQYLQKAGVNATGGTGSGKMMRPPGSLPPLPPANATLGVMRSGSRKRSGKKLLKTLSEKMIASESVKEDWQVYEEEVESVSQGSSSSSVANAGGNLVSKSGGIKNTFLNGSQASDLIPLQHESLHLNEDGSIGVQTMTTNKKKGQEQQDTHSINSIGSVKKRPYRHGYGQQSHVEMQVGDILPSGQVIKSAFPRSIVDQLKAANYDIHPVGGGKGGGIGGGDDEGGGQGGKKKKNKKKLQLPAIDA